MNQNYPEHIMAVLREYHGMERDDTSRDEEWSQLTPEDAFGIMLSYEGIYGYCSTIIEWIEDIYKVKLNSNCQRFSKQDFIQGLGNIFAAQDNMAEITAMRMDENDQVTVFFRGGGTHHANCAMDSKKATIQDIFKQAF